MRRMQRERILGIFSLCAVFAVSHATCEGERRKIPEGVKGTQGAASADELAKKDRLSFIEASRNEYPQYKNLTVDFTLKGRVSNEELYYTGELEATADHLKIKLKDAVFLSPLLTLDIGKVKVTLKDHARNKTESIPRADYQWVELFGRSFPVRFFEPLMRGYLPEDASGAESAYARTSAGDILVRSDNDSFEAAMYFNEARLKKIFYRDKLKGEILVFYLGNFFKKRIYPQTLKIEHSRSNDFLTMEFKGLNVTGEARVKKK